MSLHPKYVVTTAGPPRIARASVLAYAILFVSLHERIPRTIVAKHATENSLSRYSPPDAGSKLNLCGSTQRCLLSLVGPHSICMVTRGHQCAKSQSMN